MGSTVLVTGATGFIGTLLVDYLKKRAYRVRVLLRPQSDSAKALAAGVEAVRGDYADPSSLRRAVEGAEMVFHLAGVTKSVDREGYYRGNVLPVRSLLEAAVSAGHGPGRFLFVSSLAAAGPARNPEPGVVEEDEPHPVSAYGRSKLEAERICRSFGERLPVTIVRPPAVYGPGDRDVFQFLKMISGGLMLAAGDGRTQRFSLIHGKDLVRGILMAALSPAAVGETYFLTSPEGYSWDRVAAVASEALGVKKVRQIRLPKQVILAAGFAGGFAGRLTGRPALLNPDKAAEMVQDYWVCSPRKAEADFGFTAAIALEEGIRDTIAWYREQGWL
ncbi:epimerase [Prosthecochloris sp. GSB1]|uniref:NAD-dependent epimerase/dehydratase family protein n=1 Tax=Prosthecochloris sp. GSB1 TaxID=281093 RepID=UPI000B8C928F|nr:NAD-dependent epimerase/dehydratase family protein [Prosthecochloris sp. GSB1]ASQ91273.1 epimerase [Prosthecochloris sp. GSB1]